MSSSDTVSETLDQGSNRVAQRVGSLAGTVAPKLSRHAGSGNLAAASGVVSLARAGRTFLRGDRKRGLLQALAGLFWVGVALAQRRSGGGAGRSHTRPDAAEVADTSPDVEDAVEPGGREADHATGENVVDTTDADIDEADTAPEVDESAQVARDVEQEDVDQRDVVGGTDVEDTAGSGDESEGEGETETESADETGSETETESDRRNAGDGESASESDERVETTSGE